MALGAAIFGNTSETARLASIFIFGAFALPLYALSAAHMNDMVEQDGFVEAAGGLLLTFAIGAAIGPLLASAAMSAWGAVELVPLHGVDPCASDLLHGLSDDPARYCRGRRSWRVRRCQRYGADRRDS